MDGGLAANAPVMHGAMMLRRAYRSTLDDIYILHIDTAGSTMRRDALDSGLRSWWPFRAISYGLDLVDLTMSAQEALQVELASDLFGDRYLRISANLTGEAQIRELALDDASDKARSALYALAEDTWTHWSNEKRLAYFFRPDETIAPKSPQALNNSPNGNLSK